MAIQFFTFRLPIKKSGLRLYNFSPCKAKQYLQGSNSLKLFLLANQKALNREEGIPEVSTVLGSTVDNSYDVGLASYYMRSMRNWLKPGRQPLFMASVVGSEGSHELASWVFYQMYLVALMASAEPSWFSYHLQYSYTGAGFYELLQEASRCVWKPVTGLASNTHAYEKRINKPHQ